MNQRQEAEKVLSNLKDDYVQMATYIVQRCGDFTYDHERLDFIAEFLRAAAGVREAAPLPHVHTKACYDDPGPANGHPQQICEFGAAPPQEPPPGGPWTKADTKHWLTLGFNRVLEQHEWREVVEAARKLPYVQELRAEATLAADAGPQAQPPLDDESRCAVCGWSLAASTKEGCVPGNCSLRPLPKRAYAPARADREYGTARWAVAPPQEP